MSLLHSDWSLRTEDAWKAPKDSGQTKNIPRILFPPPLVFPTWGAADRRPPHRSLVEHSNARTKREDDQNLGAGARLRGLAHGVFRRHGGHHRAEHDPAGPRHLDGGAGMDGERLQSELRGAAADRRGAGRPPWPAAHDG